MTCIEDKDGSTDNMNAAVGASAFSGLVRREECKHGSLKRSCEICDKDVAIDRLRGQLQNCVNLLHRLKRHGHASDARAADEAIESANRALYETLGA